MTEITAEDIHAFVALAQDEAAALHKLDGAAIKAFANAWPLIDQEVLSVRNMDDHELRQAIVEELLMAEDWRRGGKEMGYRAEVSFASCRLTCMRASWLPSRIPTCSRSWSVAMTVRSGSIPRICRMRWTIVVSGSKASFR